jgi:hypothetical protein
MSDKFMPLSELKETIEWARLNAQQRELVTRYIELDHDQCAAVKATSDHVSPKSVRVTAARRFGVQVVKDCIARHFGETELSQFKAEVRRVIASPKVTPQRIHALKLLARVNGFDASALELPEPEGKILGQKESVINGRRVKTTVVDLGAASE